MTRRRADADGRAQVTVNWGGYGEYELTVDPAGTSMAGHFKGRPADWRRATFLRALGPAGPADADCGHEH